MRRVLPFAILLGCLGVGVLPALAADTVVNASSSRWNPAEFAVKPGETVRWVNASGVAHNLYVDGALAHGDGAAWSYGPQSYPARDSAYPFRCTLHPGMSGRFYVNAAGTVPAPSPTPTPSATASPTPSGTASPAPYGTATPAPGGTTTGPTGGDAAPVVSGFTARAERRAFCARRSSRCRRPGVFLRLVLRASEPVRVRGTLRRGTRRVRAVSLLVRPGSRRVRLPGPRLRAGRYSLTLRAGDVSRRVRFRVLA